ncbi:hypothetical protein CBM2599_A130022 [Cupriavidus taiwanensis]|nr:hypothetical protein CBM2599_A130022 [Cupriavidus taiwanensis]SPA50300.1 protein of unknown function [Cupriavidus taiwanensis]
MPGVYHHAGQWLKASWARGRERVDPGSRGLTAGTPAARLRHSKFLDFIFQEISSDENRTGTPRR